MCFNSVVMLIYLTTYLNLNHATNHRKQFFVKTHNYVWPCRNEWHFIQQNNMKKDYGIQLAKVYGNFWVGFWHTANIYQNNPSIILEYNIFSNKILVKISGVTEKIQQLRVRIFFFYRAIVSNIFVVKSLLFWQYKYFVLFSHT